MIPSPESWPVFWVACVPAWLLAVLWHEIGHCLAARCVGRPVLAWGLGAHKPWFYVRRGSTSFFLARPLIMGLTLTASRFPQRGKAEQFWLLAGGPLATLAGASPEVSPWSPVCAAICCWPGPRFPCYSAWTWRFPTASRAARYRSRATRPK